MKSTYFKQKTVTVIDDLTGSGKTSMIIQLINNSPIEQRFIFITPYLSEIQRIKKATKHSRTFVEPSNSKGSKLSNIKLLIDKNENIISTHALFKSFDDEILTLLRLGNYVLIMDEVSDAVEKIDVSQADIKVLKASSLIYVDASGKVSWTDAQYNGKFETLKHIIQTDKVFLYSETAFIWTFPIEMFQAFQEVYILTFFFNNGQILKNYFDMHNLKYTKKSVGIVEPNGKLIMTLTSGVLSHRVEPVYKLIDYRKPDISHLKNLIEICDDPKLNAIGESINKLGQDALTFSKLERLTKASPVVKRIKDNMINYFRHKTGAKAHEIMWTIPKKIQPIIKGKGYTNGFVSSNARASNNWIDRNTCAYMLNRYVNPSISGYFLHNGIIVDEDLFALSEMIQWLFRSSVRRGEKIQLYVPSERMRSLLKDWING